MYTGPLIETGPPGQLARQASPAPLMATGALVRCSLLLLAASSIITPQSCA